VEDPPLSADRTRGTTSSRSDRRAAALAARRAESRQARLRTRRSRFGLGALSIVAVVAGLLVIGLVAIFRDQTAAAPAMAPVVPASAPAGVHADGFTLGRADAPVTIDLFEDFQCPACLRWGDTVFPRLAANELAGGKAKLVFHGFAFIGPESRDAGRAAWAAARQDRFWDMWATLYTNQGIRENGGAFTRDRLFMMADAIGLDAAGFAADYASPDAARAVSDGVAEASRLGISGTPTLLLNGKLVDAATYDDLRAAIAGAAQP
jgi:protein-disulfide isomerase